MRSRDFYVDPSDGPPRRPFIPAATANIAATMMCLCSLSGAAAAFNLVPRVETFDIATFVPPQGWGRTESNGVLMLQDSKTVQGRPVFCQIFLYPSRPGNAPPAASFQEEWLSKVSQPLGIAPQAAPPPETTPDGWTVLTSHADFARQGVPMRAILFTATGFNKVVSIVIAVSPYAYQAELEEFFKQLNFVAGPVAGNTPRQPPPAVVPGASDRAGPAANPASGGSLASYGYTIPPQWTRQELRDAIVLTSPTYGNGEKCQISLLPTHPATRSLGDEAIGTFRAIFNADPLSSYPVPPPKLVQATSPQGWDYFVIRKLVGGQEGESRTLGSIVLVAALGDQVATVVGISKDFLVSQCFGELQTNVWPMFFYGLQFKNAAAARPSQTSIQQRLAGTWTAATATVGLGYTFQANGRYATTGLTRYAYPAPGTNTAQAFFGDGAYSIDGNTLVFTGNNRERTTQYFRLEQASTDSGQRWQDQLCLMPSGGSGEVCYRRE